MITPAHDFGVAGRNDGSWSTVEEICMERIPRHSRGRFQQSGRSASPTFSLSRWLRVHSAATMGILHDLVGRSEVLPIIRVPQQATRQFTVRAYIHPTLSPSERMNHKPKSYLKHPKDPGLGRMIRILLVDPGSIAACDLFR